MTGDPSPDVVDAAFRLRAQMAAHRKIHNLGGIDRLGHPYHDPAQFKDYEVLCAFVESSAEPRGELVAGAADMLALFIEQLMNGPPNGRHMSLRDYLTQWRLVQGALDEYNEVRKGGAPKAVAATECRSCDQLMTERDNAEEQADKLADCIAGLLGIEIGEHSNMNDPWQNAIDAAEYELDKRKRAAPEPSAEPAEDLGHEDCEVCNEARARHSPEPCGDADANRFRWLCDDHDDKYEREKAREIMGRMPVMSLSATGAAIDAAMIEFCPNRMTDGQRAEWFACQRSAATKGEKL